MVACGAVLGRFVELWFGCVQLTIKINKAGNFSQPSAWILLSFTRYLGFLRWAHQPASATWKPSSSWTFVALEKAQPKTIFCSNSSVSWWYVRLSWPAPVLLCHFNRFLLLLTPPATVSLSLSNIKVSSSCCQVIWISPAVTSEWQFTTVSSTFEQIDLWSS